MKEIAIQNGNFFNFDCILLLDYDIDTGYYITKIFIILLKKDEKTTKNTEPKA